MEKDIRVIVSGGGTGGHIFPAVSIANAIKAKRPNAEILFVGALGRMEMQRVPAAGYKIIGLPVRGFKRPLWSPANIGVALDFLKSKRMIRKTIKEFAPDVVVGVGGYASAATLDAASSLGIPTLIQEQNSYAGVTNKHLAAKAKKICVAYDGMERFFPADKIINTGNPVRQNLIETTITREQAIESFGLDPQKKTILSSEEASEHAPSTKVFCSISTSLRRAECSLSGRRASITAPLWLTASRTTRSCRC